ncbi:ABHD17A [Symbiodinium sp. CCMP2592]|nr:ABHD17A [Symbiodinium sp. CCMP2592]
MDFGRVKIFHHIDASAAKAMLERSGVGKVRIFLAEFYGILWCQQLIKSGEVALLKISATFNPSDLGTKGLSRARTLMLMCILRVWDEMCECFVGAQELREEREKQSIKQNMKVIRNIRVPIMISKSALRAMVSATLVSGASALGFGGAFEMFAMLYALMFEEFPMMTLMMLYLFTLAVIGTILCMRPQLTVIVKGFDKSLCSGERAIDISSRTSSKDSISSSVTGEEMMIKQTCKRRVKEPVNPVWIAGEYGKKYHMLGCGKLNGSLEVSEISEEDAIAKSLKPCSFCNPRKVYHPEEFVTKSKMK